MFKLSKSIRKELPKFTQHKQAPKSNTSTNSSIANEVSLEPKQPPNNLPTTSTTKKPTSATPAQHIQLPYVDNTPTTPHLFTRLDAFTGAFSWLGLIYPVSVYYNGHPFPSAYHALIMAQYESVEIDQINQLSKEEELLAYTKDKTETKDWQKTRLKIMEQIQRDKFRRSEELQGKLKETGNRQLVWTNRHDSFFGSVNSTGQNHLGRILEQIRDDINNGDEFIAWLLMCHDINTDMNTQPTIRMVETKEGLDEKKIIELKNKSYYKIGKLPDNDIIPLNPSVSRRHALITSLKNGEVLIFDLKSKSKTYLNGNQLETDHFGYSLKNLDVITLGTSSRKYSVEIDNKNVMENLEKRVRDLNREIKQLSGDVDTSMGVFIQGSTKVFVGNLSFDTDRNDLEEFFSGCGEIKSIHIPQKRTSEMDNESTGDYCTRGIAFIDFYTPAPTKIAILKDGRSLNNRAIKVNMIDPKDKQKEHFPQDSNIGRRLYQQNSQRNNYHQKSHHRGTVNDQLRRDDSSRHRAEGRSPELHDRVTHRNRTRSPEGRMRSPVGGHRALNKHRIRSPDGYQRAHNKRRIRSPERDTRTLPKRRVRPPEGDDGGAIDRLEIKSSQSNEIEQYKDRMRSFENDNRTLDKHRENSFEKSDSQDSDKHHRRPYKRNRSPHKHHKKSPPQHHKGPSKQPSKTTEHRINYSERHRSLSPQSRSTS